MQNSLKTVPKNTLYLIYDGDCILCRNSAQAIKIKESVGNLEIINARTSHRLVTEVLEKGYDLNEGILVKYNEQYYYGADAIHFLALIGSSSTTFNKINSVLFKYKWLSHFLYPFFKFGRNSILFFRGIPQLTMPIQKPLAEKIFGNKTQYIPRVLQARYSNRPYSTDSVLLKGEMNIKLSKIFKIVSPLFRLVGALVPYAAENIPVTVEFVSDEKSNKIVMHRTFYYTNRPPYHFRAKVIHIENNIVLEVMRFGFASKLLYRFEKNTIFMDYGGYVLRVGKLTIPLPLGFLIGKFTAFEKAIDENRFSMQVKIDHFMFGTVFQYDGDFDVVKKL